MKILTEEQEKWIARLDSKKKIEIFPYNPLTKNVFEKIKTEIKDFLGNGNIKILHCGSTALKILGQGEIDLYIPVNKKDFNNYLEKLIKYFGKPGSVYPLKRVRFVKYINNIKIEIFLINKKHGDWKNLVKFEKYLKENKKALEKYKRIKQQSRGLSIRDYYRKKLEFINKILQSA